MAASENQCERMQDLLSLFVDGQLAPADVARVEAHIAHCAGCASYLGFLRATSFVIANRLPEVRPPADLYARIAQMTYERPVQPTWSQRLSRLLAPTPTRWALGTALAAAGIVGVAVLPQRMSDKNVNKHSPIRLAAASPTSVKATNKTNNEIAVAHPLVKAPATIAPPALADTLWQTAMIAPDKSADKPMVAPLPAHIAKAPAKEAPAIAVALPTPVKRSALPALPATKPATHSADNVPHLVIATAPKTPVVRVDHDAISESIRKTLREREARDVRTLANREMGANQRKAAIEAHEGTAAESGTSHEIPVEPSNVGAPSAPATIAITALTRVAEFSSSPRRHTLVGYDEGQKPRKYSLPGLDSKHLAPVDTNNSGNIVSAPMGTDYTDEKQPKSLQN